MKQKITLLIAFFALILFAKDASAQGTVPEILYYKFDQSGTTVTNEASSPPAGTATSTIIGGLTQGGVGLCQTGLIGTGGSSSTDYISTGWNTDLGNNPWTIAFWIDNIPNNSTLYYHFGDLGAGSFRCFNNGVAGVENYILRGGGITDVYCNGCAPIGAPSMVTFVYDPVAGNITSYHDGVLNSVVAQPALNISGTDFKVGSYSTSTGMPPAAIMDEFRFYDRALDAQEVFETYDACLPLSSSPDDAGVSSIDEPTNFCAGTQDVVATIRNYGINQIDSCIVQWEMDAVPQTPYYYYGLLDTVGGTGSTSAQVTLGSALFTAGVTYNIVAWTELPNGVMDTVTNNDTTSILVQSSLAGNFTIGGTSPDYADFSSAVADLNAYGICGATTFDVRPGTYTEQISLGNINGTSSTNTITFRSENGDRNSVLLTFPATSSNNYTLQFNGVDHLSFEQMTVEATDPSYGHVIEFGNASDSNTVWDCGIIGVPVTTTSTNMAVLFSTSSQDSYNSFIGNTFANGSYGVYFRGTGTTALEIGNVFDNNEFVDAYYQGTYLYYQEAPIFTNNNVTSTTAYTGSVYGNYFAYCQNEMVVSGNKTVVGPDNYGYGMYFSNCDGTAAVPSRIFNNMVSVGNPNTTSTSYGIYYTNMSRSKFSHNSVYLFSDGTSSRAFYATGGGVNELKNNNFMMDGAGYAAYYASIYSINDSDNNNFFSSGPKFIYFGSGDVVDLAAYQVASGQDAGGISVDPMFQSFDDLHVCNALLDGAGTPVATVTVDIDGTPRDAGTPDIGADEFAPLSSPFLGADALICTGETLTLWAGSPSDTILWSTGDTTQSIDVTAPGTYYVDVISVCGNGTDTIVIDPSALVYSGFLDADTTFFCLPGSATLSTSSVGTYDWSTTETTQSISVTAGGTYSLTFTDACGSGTESVVIVGADTPAPSFSTVTSYVTAFFTNTSTTQGTLTFDWNFGDGGTSTNENPAHVYSAAGTYFVSLTITNECGSSTFSDSVTVSTVGIEELGEGNAMSIYPNPNNGTFALSLSLTENANVDMFVTNELGQKIYSSKVGEIVGNTVETIDLGNVEAGLYFVTILVNEKPYVSKFIVK